MLCVGKQLACVWGGVRAPVCLSVCGVALVLLSVVIHRGRACLARVTRGTLQLPLFSCEGRTHGQEQSDGRRVRRDCRPVSLSDKLAPTYARLSPTVQAPLPYSEGGLQILHTSECRK